MNVLNTAAILASEGAEGSGTVVPGWAFGLFAFVVFVVLLVATMMIKVDRD